MTILPPSSLSLSPCLSRQIPPLDRLLVNTRYDNLFSREAVNRGSILHPISRVVEGGGWLDRGWSKLAAVTCGGRNVTSTGIVSKSDKLLPRPFGVAILSATQRDDRQADAACFVHFIALHPFHVAGGSIRFIETVAFLPPLCKRGGEFLRF